ncbi:MAG: bifunctional nuclease family protein [Deltaproteobacteria bacterium]|nr:bifunctional nuclease family protein [Deltaproteobacteria bacterium]
MLIEVTVAGLALDPRTDSPILLLRDSSQNRILPIWIGVAEATAIAAQVEGIRLPRPMTHDLTQNLVNSLGGRISRVAITSLVDATYYAQVTLVANEQQNDLDARPSDAVALALRAAAPIYVDDQVFQQGAAMLVDTGDGGELDAGSRQEEPAAAANASGEGVETQSKGGAGADAIEQSPAERWGALLDHVGGGKLGKN